MDDCKKCEKKILFGKKKNVEGSLNWDRKCGGKFKLGQKMWRKFKLGQEMGRRI